MRTRTVPFSILFASFCIGCAPLYGQIAFSEPYPVAPNLHTVSKAFMVDLNGDDHNELILGSTGPGRAIAIDGEQNSLAWPILEGMSNRVFFEMVDVDADGFVDMITGGQVSSDQFRTYLYRGTSSGVFLDPVVQTALPGFVNVAFSDLNNDGLLEMITYSFYLGCRIFHYSPVTNELLVLADIPGSWRQIVPTDQNSDGINDLLLLSYYSPYSVSIWQSSTPSQVTPLTAFVGTVVSMMPADLNGDGSTDLLVSSSAQQIPSLTAWIAQGSSGFVQGPAVDLGSSVSNFFVTPSTGGSTALWATSGLNLLRFTLSGAIELVARDTVLSTPDPIRSYSFRTSTPQGPEDILVMTGLDRCYRSAGTTDGSFGTDLELLYTWNHRYTGAIASTENAYAFVHSTQTNQIELTLFDSLHINAWATGTHIALPRTNFQNSLYWQVLSKIYSADLDQDGDLDIFGFRNAYDTNDLFNSCQRFAVELGEAIPIRHCPIDISNMTFDTYINYDMDRWDVNGDGTKDVSIRGASVNYTPNYSYPGNLVALGTEDPFEWAQHFGPLPSYGDDLIIHKDLDGDGVDDLLTKDYSTNSLKVLRNNGGFSFTETVSTDLDANLFGLPSQNWLDADGDGHLEVLRFISDTSEVSIYAQSIYLDSIGPPQLFFQNLEDRAMAFPRSIDLNGDGMNEIVTYPEFEVGYNSPDMTIKLWSRTGLATWESVSIYDGAPYSVRSIKNPHSGMTDILLINGPNLLLMKNQSIPLAVAQDRPLLDQVRIFPNPAADHITVDLGSDAKIPMQLDILDATGRLLTSRRTTTALITLSLEGIQQGTYVLRVNDANNGQVVASRTFVRL